jgi:HTH-type transcriptional regulator/antitoxin HigA
MDNILAETFPAGEHLADELGARGWTQAEFAEILGRPTQFVSEIISGKKEITRESAAQIGAALGNGAEFWLKLQDSFFLWKQRQDPQVREVLSEVETRAKLNGLAPMAVLRKRGIITASSTEEQAEQLRRLMGINSLDERPSWCLAARRSNRGEPLSPVQNAWFACVKKIADSLTAKQYDRDRLKHLATSVSQIVRGPSGLESLPSEFASVGVRLVYFEAFPSSKISGASFQDDRGPVIALSGRGQRLDKVLFTILHEAAHIARGDTEAGALVIDEDDHTLGNEDRADDLAADWMMPTGLPEAPPRVTKEWIEDVAANLNLHPIVVIGRLQREHILPWRTTLVKDAPNATEYLRKWPGHLVAS